MRNPWILLLVALGQLVAMTVALMVGGIIMLAAFNGAPFWTSAMCAVCAVGGPALWHYRERMEP